MKFKKKVSVLVACALSATMLFGCQSIGKSSDDEKITLVWYPNESGGDLEEARNAIGEVVEKALGKEVEHQLTTDYTVAIETMANDKAHISFMGPQGYVEANAKNDAIQPLVVPSGPSGTLDDAVYYSWLAVNKGEEENYKDGDDYSIDNIEGKKVSFVSNSSTSGFKVPSSSIVNHFSKDSKWSALTQEDLMIGGNDKFFKEVMFGGTHQGSTVNLLTGKVDVAAFCDTVLAPYIEKVSGDASESGSVFKIKDGAAEPFNSLVGKEYSVISSTPVLNSPLVMNTNLLTEEEQEKLIAEFTTEETTNNPKIFQPKDSEEKGFFPKSADERFLSVEDAWFEPIRNLNK